MLQIKPTCENCQRQLPPHSSEARICSYECTFCADCVDGVLMNACPNCGGGFAPRPVRPAKEWVAGVSLAHQPAATDETHKTVDPATHAAFATVIAPVSPQNR